MNHVYQDHFFTIWQEKDGSLLIENRHDERCKMMVSPHHSGMVITAIEDRLSFCVEEGFPAIKVEPIGGETVEEL